MEITSIVDFAQESRTLPETIEDFKNKINEGFKKVSEDVKRELKIFYDFFFTSRGIPEDIKKEPTKSLINGFYESLRDEDIDWADRINILRQIAINLNINPFTVFVGLLVAGLGLFGISELLKAFAKKNNTENLKNVRGSSIDRHRNNMKRYNMRINTTMHQKDVGQL